MNTNTVLRRYVIRVIGLLVAGTAAAGVCTPLSAQDGASPAWSPKPLAESSVRSDVALLRRALEEVHAGYDRYVPRRVMDTAFARLDRRAAQPMSDIQLYREIALLLAKIRCNHTKAEYPEALERYRSSAATHLPVRVRIFGSRIFVAASSDPKIARGTEILGINGHAAPEIITTLSRYASVDGFTDFVRPTLLEQDSDLMGSDLDHYWPIEFGLPSAWTMTLRSPAGVAQTRTLAPITYAAWRALGGETERVDFANGTTLAMLDDSTARLTIRSFVNYRTPVNADSVYHVIFTQLKARSVRYLIVDLRGNGGGSDDASAGLIAYLADTLVRPLTSVRRRTIRIDSTLSAAFDTWGDRAPIFTPAESLFTKRADGWYLEHDADAAIRPSPLTFTGRVSILVGRRNSSASTMLLATLQQLGARTHRLRLVGEETGGSAEGPTAGQILFLRLPASDIRVRVPLKRSDVNVAGFAPAMGVFPDIDATESLADFRGNVDRALLTARRTSWQRPDSPLSATIGLMRGELEYRDYGSGARVLLPTWIHTAPIGGSGAFRQRTVYDDGPGKTIYSADVLRVTGAKWVEGGGTNEDGTPSELTTLRIVSRQRVPAGVRFELRGRGTDDRKPVEFRYRVTLSDTSATRLKEFRLPGQSWQYRHDYRFSRADGR